MKEVLIPQSLSELWHQLDARSDAQVYAGGTDLLVKMRSGLVRPPSLICLEGIDQLRGITEEPDAIRIGSCATHTQLLEYPAISHQFSVLARALKGLGSPPIRNMGTIGGNICTASPAGDTLPALYVLDADVELRTKAGERRMHIRDFIIGPGLTRIERGEILSAIRVRKPDGYNVHHFEKVGQRNALACSIASLAALLRFSPDGVVEKAALAWGSVAPVILTCPEAEKILIGKRLSLKNIDETAAIVRDAVRPISDVRADAGYRRQVSGNLLYRLMSLPAMS